MCTLYQTHREQIAEILQLSNELINITAKLDKLTSKKTLEI